MSQSLVWMQKHCTEALDFCVPPEVTSQLHCGLFRQVLETSKELDAFVC
jgi:hypothetical protein